MTCDFTSFSTVVLSYQDDGQVIMKSSVQWNNVYDYKDLRITRGSNMGPLDQRANGARIYHRFGTVNEKSFPVIYRFYLRKALAKDTPFSTFCIQRCD